MAHYKVILAYDGTHFSGMQRQPALRTIQGEIETALRKLDWLGETILIAGRTDAGVHATGQVIAFELPWRQSEAKLLSALNALLPRDVSAKSVNLTTEAFHPRYDAAARCYRYQLFSAPERDPLRERYAWRVIKPVDVALMNQAVRPLVGAHDFKWFGAPTQPDGPTIRRVDRAKWTTQGDLIVLDIQANAFLHHMIRRIVRLSVMIGNGTWPLARVKAFLKGEEPQMVQGLAPPEGLFLTDVRYPRRE